MVEIKGGAFIKKRFMALGLCAMIGFSAGNIQPVQAAVNIPSENAVAYTHPINGKEVKVVNSDLSDFIRFCFFDKKQINVKNSEQKRCIIYSCLL